MYMYEYITSFGVIKKIGSTCSQYMYIYKCICISIPATYRASQLHVATMASKLLARYIGDAEIDIAKSCILSVESMHG